MDRLRTRLAALAVAASILLGGLLVVGLSGCDVAENEDFYRKGTEVAPGRAENPYSKYAVSYVLMVVFAAFTMWVVCKSSRRSVVKAGKEH